MYLSDYRDELTDLLLSCTVNSEIFARILFMRNFARSFAKVKPSRNGEIALLLTDVGKSCPSRDFFMSQICLLTRFVNISEFTVIKVCACCLIRIFVICSLKSTCTIHAIANHFWSRDVALGLWALQSFFK